MATYDDYEGVWFSVNALRLYHAAEMPRIEILVVDNHPDSVQGRLTRSFIENWVSNGRYVGFSAPVGTAPPKNEVFRQARGRSVLCIDSHVLLEPDSLRRLLEYYDTHPDCQDLLQGPLVYDNLQTYSSHFADEWRGEMWGVWGTDPRAEFHRQVSELPPTATGERLTSVRTTEGPAFEIPAQGLGLFSCRKDSWLGFHPGFRGFGGEEFYIHEKYRQAGRRTLCLPFLRWVHRFNRPRGVPYPLTKEHKFRNYVLGLTELGLPLEPAIRHFSTRLSAETMQAILAAPEREPVLRPKVALTLRRSMWSDFWSDLRHTWRRAFPRPPRQIAPQQKPQR